MAHEERVERRFDDESERDHGLTEVVRHEQLFDQPAKRLPFGHALPRLLATPETRRAVLELARAISETLNASHLVGRLERKDRDELARRRELADVRAHHLQAVARVKEHGQPALEAREPAHVELAVVPVLVGGT